MTTSGTTAWSMSALAIVQQALRENSIITLDETPTTDEIAACLVCLNGILRSWIPASWLGSTATITVPANAASGALPAELDEILSVRMVQSSTYERPLNRWGRSEYLEMPNKLQTGDPISYYVDNQRDSIIMYVWPVPTSDTTLKVEYLRFPEIITDSAQTVDFPQKYNELLFVSLAMRCAGIFGRQPTPELVARASLLQRQFEDGERPETYIIETGLD